MLFASLEIKLSRKKLLLSCLPICKLYCEIPHSWFMLVTLPLRRGCPTPQGTALPRQWGRWLVYHIVRSTLGSVASVCTRMFICDSLNVLMHAIVVRAEV
jgi:hypothetical protein